MKILEKTLQTSAECTLPSKYRDPDFKFSIAEPAYLWCWWSSPLREWWLQTCRKKNHVCQGGHNFVPHQKSKFYNFPGNFQKFWISWCFCCHVGLYLIPTILKVSQNRWVWKETCRGQPVKPRCSNWARAGIFRFKRMILFHRPSIWSLPFSSEISCGSICSGKIKLHHGARETTAMFSRLTFLCHGLGQLSWFCTYFGGKWSSKPLQVQMIVHFTDI